MIAFGEVRVGRIGWALGLILGVLTTTSQASSGRFQSAMDAGRKALTSGQLAPAARAFSAARRLAAGHPSPEVEALAYLGLVLEKAGRADEGVRAYRLALALVDGPLGGKHRLRARLLERLPAEPGAGAAGPVQTPWELALEQSAEALEADDLDRAEQAAHRALASSAEAGEVPLARAQLAMARLHRRLGRTYEAHDLAVAATQVLEARTAAGDGEARFRLAQALMDGPLARNSSRAVELYQLGAQAGDLRATVNLGVAYHHGLGVGRDIHEAMAWYRRAADAGHSLARFNLAVCLLRGDGVEPDPDEGAALLRLAAADGVVAAQEALSALGLDRGMS